jgi:hypothetical protein
VFGGPILIDCCRRATIYRCLSRVCSLLDRSDGGACGTSKELLSKRSACKMAACSSDVALSGFLFQMSLIFLASNEIAPGRRVCAGFSVRMASLERARFHQRFFEHKIQSGARTVASLPYVEPAHVCFSAVRSMPKGEAADRIRSHAAAFYTEGVADRKVSPSEAEAKAAFQSIAAGWALPETPE